MVSLARVIGTIRPTEHRAGLIVLLAFLVACGGSDGKITETGRKPDPFVTVRFRNLADTTTAIGRADWKIFMDITSADPNQTGFVFAGEITLTDRRLNHLVRCQGVGADSIGQRLIAFVALADTTSETTSHTTADAVARAWVAGNHAVPEGWMAFYQPPTDAWTSDQFLAGHGLVQSDPIKWGFDWTGANPVVFYERTDQETTCSTF